MTFKHGKNGWTKMGACSKRKKGHHGCRFGGSHAKLRHFLAHVATTCKSLAIRHRGHGTRGARQVLTDVKSQVSMSKLKSKGERTLPCAIPLSCHGAERDAHKMPFLPCHPHLMKTNQSALNSRCVKRFLELHETNEGEQTCVTKHQGVN